VLVHGAFADASSWDEVIKRLQKHGHTVMAPANPLRGLASDSAYIASVLKSISSGPIVLVGHSYGGAVITNAAAGNPNVKALVYVAAYLPDVRETAQQLTDQFPGSQVGSNTRSVPFVVTGATGTDLYLDPAKYQDLFTGPIPAASANAMAVAQRPVATTALSEPSQAAAWKTIPSWAIVAGNDRLIPPDAERFMAHRARSHMTEIPTAWHAAMLLHADAVTRVIIAAANGVYAASQLRKWSE
jgi:pimeloyl-ACP methyl ester carboxylesterase